MLLSRCALDRDSLSCRFTLCTRSTRLALAILTTKLHVCPGHYGTVVGSRARGRWRDARPGVSSLLPVTCATSYVTLHSDARNKQCTQYAYASGRATLFYKQTKAWHVSNTNCVLRRRASALTTAQAPLLEGCVLFGTARPAKIPARGLLERCIVSVKSEVVTPLTPK